MEIKNLNTFIQVAELNSFTKAAEKLGYSQSTVSFQIRQLEEELNTQLFERINHTVTLTSKGRDVLSYAHQINKLTKEMLEPQQPKQEICGHIRMAMSDSLCRLLLQDDFGDFRLQYPGITLKVISAGTEEMFRLLNHNEVDLVYTLDSHIYHAEYRIAQEEQVKMHFVAAKNHPLAKKEILSVRDLVQEPFVLTEKGMSYRRLLDNRLAAESLEIQPILEISSTDLVSRLVEQGIGLSFLPDFTTKKMAAEGRLVYLNVIDCQIEVWKQLLYHRDKWLSPQMESVIKYLSS